MTTIKQGTAMTTIKQGVTFTTIMSQINDVLTA